jgi:hypothetical protein
MSRFSALKTTLKEIINLSKRSDILADQKSKIFCNYYLNLKNNETTKLQLFKSLSEEHGLKSERLFTKVSYILRERNILMNNFIIFIVSIISIFKCKLYRI